MDSTKAIEERLTALEQTVAKIPRRGRGLAGAEERLREAALQYAGMSTDGWMMDGRDRVRVGANDRKDYEDLFVREMKCAAKDMLRELGVEETR